MAYKQKSPLPIKEGGSNAVSMANTYGVNYFDGSALLTTAVGTATHVLTSNGAGVAPTFQAAGGGELSTSVVLTSSQVKALNTTPIELIAAPGSGNVIQVFGVSVKMTYGGTNVFTGPSFSTINLGYDGSPPIDIGFAMSKGSVIRSADAYAFNTNLSPDNLLSTMENKKVVIYNPSTDFAGNAADDNTVTVTSYYRIAAV